MTLAIFYLFGYTLNRVTLFALIFSIGILVDDAIVVVENIVRHFRLPGSRGRSLVRCCGGSGGRSGQSHDPGDLRRDCGDSAHGFCARPNGAIHAADSGGRIRGDGVFLDRGIRGFALGGVATAAPLRVGWRPRSSTKRRAGPRGFYRRLMNPLIL